MNTSVLVKLKKHPQDLWAENAEPMTHMSLRGLNLSYFRCSTKELVSSSSSAAVNSIVTCWHVRTFWFKFFTNHRASSHHRLWSYLRFYIIATHKKFDSCKATRLFIFQNFHYQPWLKTSPVPPSLARAHPTSLPISSLLLPQNFAQYHGSKIRSTSGRIPTSVDPLHLIHGWVTWSLLDSDCSFRSLRLLWSIWIRHLRAMRVWLVSTSSKFLCTCLLMFHVIWWWRSFIILYVCRCTMLCSADASYGCAALSCALL